MSTRHPEKLVGTQKIDYRSKREIIKHDVIKDYNRTMGGVDTLSRVIKPYSLQRKGLKWYRKIGELFFDVTIYNAFVFWKKINVNNKAYHLKFRQDLTKIIVMYHLTREKSLYPGRGEQMNYLHNPLRLIVRHFPSQKN